MIAYIFDSSKPEPSFITENAVRNKADVIKMVEAGKTKVLGIAENNLHRSIGYYRALEKLFDSFLERLSFSPLPNLTDPWWLYVVDVSNAGISLKMQNIMTVDYLVEDGEAHCRGWGTAGPYTLVETKARKLTVEEYAQIYGVEAVTVRQWIRRGKIRTAEKEGKEWRIPELTDIPKRGFEEATYTVMMGAVPEEDLPEEYWFLENAMCIEVSTDENEKDSFVITVHRLTDSNPFYTTKMSGREREKFELHLIANQKYVYQDGHYTFDTISTIDLFHVANEVVTAESLEATGIGVEVADYDAFEELSYEMMRKRSIFRPKKEEDTE